jgi:hypothetical protein
VAGAGDGLFGSHDAVVKDTGQGQIEDANSNVNNVNGTGSRGTTRPAAKKASDGRLLATVVKIIRVSAFVHAAVSFFLFPYAQLD